MSTITLDENSIRVPLTRAQLDHEINNDFLAFISNNNYHPDDRDKGIVMWLRANHGTATAEDNSAIINFYTNNSREPYSNYYSDNEVAELMNSSVSVEEIRAWVSCRINIDAATAANIIFYANINDNDKINIIGENLGYLPIEELSFLWACCPSARRIIASHSILNNNVDEVFSKSNQYYNELHRKIKDMNDFLALSDVSDEVLLGVYI